MAGAAGAITGPASVCKGQTGVVFSVAAIANATGYNWTLPAGASLASGGNTNSITVDFASWAISGNISVYGMNSCGNGAVSPNLALTVNPIPPRPFIYLYLGTLWSNAVSGNQWYLDGVPISGATGQSWVPAATGTYTDVVTVNGCNSPVSEEIYIVMTGTSEKDRDNMISVYPNPSDGQFSFSITASTPETFNVSVVNPLGVKVFEMKDLSVTGTVTKTLDLRQFPGGIYSLVLINNNSNIVKKILIRK